MKFQHSHLAEKKGILFFFIFNNQNKNILLEMKPNEKLQFCFALFPKKNEWQNKNVH